MTESFTHNLLVDSICQACETSGIAFTRECAVRTEYGIGFIDLVASDATTTLAIEVERSNRRIERDLAKAIALHADELLIVVPNPQVKRAVERRLRQLDGKKRVATFVTCLPKALTRLTHCFPSRLIRDGKREISKGGGIVFGKRLGEGS